MKKRRPLHCLAPSLAVGLALMAPALGAGAAEKASPQGLSLSNALERALAFNLGLKIERKSTAQAREDVNLQRAGFDPVLQAGASAQESRQAAAVSELDGSDQPISEGQNLRASVSKKTSLGTQLSLDGEASRSETDSSYARLNPAYDTELGLSIRQPLLKGAGASVNLLGVRLGEIAASRADLALRAKVLDLLKDTEKTYWDLAYAQAALDVREAARLQAQRLVQETQARRQAGLVTDVDVVQAQAEEAGQQEQVLLARQEVLNAGDRLLILLGRLKADDPAPAATEPLTSARLPESFSIKESLAAARDGQPEYLSQQQAIQGRHLEVDAARQNRWPSLDLSGRAGYSGQAGDLQEAADSMRRHDGYRWQAGLELSAPWGFREERSRLRKSYLGLAQEQLRMEQLDQALIQQLRTAGRSFSIAEERLQAAAASRGLREEQAAMMRARYSAGAATLRDTLSAENELETARLRELRTRLERIEAAQVLERLEGRLPVRHGLRWAELDEPEETSP